MPSSSLLLILLILFGLATSVSPKAIPTQENMGTVIGLYEENIVVPCPYPSGEKLELVVWFKWSDGPNGHRLLLQNNPDEAKPVIYAPRVNIYGNSSLLISQVRLEDQGVYVCLVTVSTVDLPRNYISVVVYKKPALPVVVNKADFLQVGLLTRLGTCVVRDGNPAAKLTWQKNGRPLVSDGMHIVVTSTVAKNSSTGLTTSSTLQYNATMQDVNARFNCLSSHELGTEESEPSSVAVYKKPALPVVVNKADFLQVGALTQLGTCVARDGNPAANITWQKNGRPLVSDGMHIVVTSTVAKNSSTGLTTSSTLQYNATMQDVNARFNCLSTHELGTEESEPSSVAVYKKPAPPVVVNKADFLQAGAVMRLGTCVAKDAYPAANITWQKNGWPLVSDGMHIVVTSTVAKNSSTGLTTSSTLHYNATMQDVNARFNCLSTHELGTEESEPSSVAVYKKPAPPVVVNKADFLQAGTVMRLGTCVVKDAYPAANITWQKNGRPLVSDGMHIVVTSTVAKDSSNGLFTTSSILHYNATKQDVNARFNCLSTHELGTEESEPLTIPTYYPTERLSLTVLTPEGPITEGDDVNLKCLADGNPPPSSYNFDLKNQTVLVENSDSYTLKAVTRDSAGEYKCSLVDDETIEASLSIAVSYLDLSLSPTGKVVKMLSEPLEVKMEVSPSGNNAKVSWTKDGEKMEAAPEFGNLSYTDVGSYTCEVSSAGLTRRQSFDLVVEGSPVITNLTQDGAQQDGAHPNSIQLACEAQGVPRPVFVWNVSTTEDESSYNERDGKASKKVTVVPNGQSMYVTCRVSNRLGADARTIVVPFVGTSWPKLVITFVLVLLVLMAVAGSMAYRRRRRGSWTPVQMDPNPKGQL